MRRGEKMKSVNETVIAWNTEPMEIGLFPINEVPKKYRFISGAAFIAVREMTTPEAESYILYESLRLIINYKFDPTYVQRQLNKLKEYNTVVNKFHDLFYWIDNQ
jgi:hypothetical protein